MARTGGECSRDDCLYAILQYSHSLAGNAALLALFAVLLPVSCVLGARYHSTVFSTTIFSGLLLEVIGYVGRILLALSRNQTRADYALSQLGTVLAPTVISLAAFRLMPPIVAAYGEQYRPWRPTWHNVVFYAFTIICLVLQAVGAVLSTVSDNTILYNFGIRLLVAGLAIHLFSLLVFVVLGFRFALAVRQRKGGWDRGSPTVHDTARFKSFLFGITLTTLLLLARAIYRTIAVARDFSAMERSEVMFLVLDGAFVFVATALLLVLFPGKMLSSAWFADGTSLHDRRMTQKGAKAAVGGGGRPAPIQLERASYAPYHTRVSSLQPSSGEAAAAAAAAATTYSPGNNSSNMHSPQTYQAYSPHGQSPKNVYSPKTSPRRSMIPPPSQRTMVDQRRNMVDSEQLW